MANNFPNLRPSFSADFVNGAYVDPRITFSRAGTRTYFGREVVKAEENLLLRSQEFNSGVWIKSSATIVTGVSDPFGGTSAQLMYPDSSGVFRGVFQANLSGYLNTATAKVFTIYAKASGLNFIFLTNASSGGERTFFDVSTGVVGTVAAATTATITSVGSGWYRCTVTTSAAWTSSPSLGWYFADADNTTTATTSGTDGVAVYGAQLEQRSFATAYTATTTQPITRYQRQLKTAAANEWPREFDPVTGECLGRSVWESRTNIWTYSEFQDSTGLNLSNVTLDAMFGPSGNWANAYRFGTSGTTRFVYGKTTVASTTYTMSVFVKMDDGLAPIFGSSTPSAVENDFAIQLGNAATNPATYTVKNIGNGLYVVSATGVTGPTNLVNNGVLKHATNSARGFRVTGFQLEAGAFATPYIPTVASQVTRLADSAVMTGVNFSSWFNPSEGAFFVDATNSGASGIPINIHDGTANNQCQVLTGTSGTAFLVITENVIQANIGTRANPAKTAASYKFNDFMASTNGSVPATDTSGTLPVVSVARIGSRYDNSNHINGYIKRLTYYNQALTSANLQAITR
jgi:hypothetical protein